MVPNTHTHFSNVRILQKVLIVMIIAIFYEVLIALSIKIIVKCQLSNEIWIQLWLNIMQLSIPYIFSYSIKPIANVLFFKLSCQTAILRWVVNFDQSFLINNFFKFYMVQKVTP